MMLAPVIGRQPAARLLTCPAMSASSAAPVSIVVG
jgi:hypothetical protein